MEKIIRHPVILKRDTTALLVIDIQEKILKVMQNYEVMLANVVKLIKGIKILNVPIFYTEQYPKGLGKTVEAIQNELEGEAIQKLSFSCIGAENLIETLKQNNIKQVIVVGIEAHVCVQQTVLDLLANGFQVNLPINAVSSRFQIDFETAINRMSKHGVETTTVESILFELLNVCTTPEFKPISSLLK